jgi:hypothetical protein
MKFYILVKTKEWGDIESEDFPVEDTKKYEEVMKKMFIDSTEVTTKLDFYDKKGNFVVIPTGVLQNSLIYVIHKK